MFNRYPYDMFNQEYLNHLYQQQAAEKHREQQKKICDMVKAISDLFEASRELSPEYWEQARMACFMEILRQNQIDQNRYGGMR